MPQLDMDARRCIIVLRHRGYSVSQIRARLVEENIMASRISIHKLLRRKEETGTVTDRKRKRTPRILQSEHLHFVDNTMANDNELTAQRLRYLLEEDWPKLKVSLATIKCVHEYKLGLIHFHPKYCQLVRTVNKEKQLAWCKKSLEDGDQFDDVLWSDECSIQQDHHGR